MISVAAALSTSSKTRHYLFHVSVKGGSQTRNGFCGNHALNDSVSCATFPGEAVGVRVTCPQPHTSPDADPGRWWHSRGCQPDPALLEPAQAGRARSRANAGLISEAPLIVDRQRQWQDWKKKWVVTGSRRTTKGDQRQNGFRPRTPGLNTGPSGGSEGGELHPAQGTALAPPV